MVPAPPQNAQAMSACPDHTSDKAWPGRNRSRGESRRDKGSEKGGLCPSSSKTRTGCP